MKVYTLKNLAGMIEVVITDSINAIWDLVISEGWNMVSVADL